MLCVEQGCVHWRLPGSPLQQRGVSQPIPPGFGMSLHSAPGEQLVKGAAGSPKDRLPKAQHGGVPSIGTVWPGGRQDIVLGVLGWQRCSPIPRDGPTPHTPAALAMSHEPAAVAPPSQTHLVLVS